MLGWTVLAPAWFWTLAVVVDHPGSAADRLDARVAPEAGGRAAAPASPRRVARGQACTSPRRCLRWRAFRSRPHGSRCDRAHDWPDAGHPPASAGMESVGRTRIASHERADGLLASYRAMWIAPFVAVATAVYVAASAPVALAVAGADPVPLVRRSRDRLVDQPTAPPPRVQAGGRPDVLSPRTARKTWAFFETFVGAEDHWLPPDNYQEHPVAALAHRTSPTNMGLALLANLSAYDFGYIHAGQLIERTGHALDTMDALERHQGHFYNWYDTQSLKPLPPLYVSSVDSGNLAGHLLTLRPGLLALPDDSILGARLFEGLHDTLAALKDVAAGAVAVASCDSAAEGPGIGTRCATRHARGTADLAGPAGGFRDGSGRRPRSRHRNRARQGSRVVGGRAGKANPKRAGRADVSRALARRCLPARIGSPTFCPPPGSRHCANFQGSRRTCFLRSSSGARRGRNGREQRMAAGTRAARDGSKQPRQPEDRGARRPGPDVGKSGGHGIRLPVRQGAPPARHRVQRRRAAARFRATTICWRRRRGSRTFVAIAQGKLPQESWFALGRLLTTVGGDATLLSWSGSMFEYLMPLLVMPTYENTLLDDTCRAAVKRQIAYGSQRGVPWGISECGYNTVDAALNYQYRAFGVPGLGLKRGLADDLVIAPYASALALMVAPEEACSNLQRLAAAGLEGRYGFYEAIDYTPSRLPRGQSQRGRAFVHGASPGHDFPVPGALPPGPSDAEAVRIRAGVPGDRLAAAGTRSQGRRVRLHTAELSGDSRDFQRSVHAGARPRPVRHAVSRSAAPVERQIPRDGHQRGRRLQPLERPRRHALARRHDLRQLGHVLLHPRRGERESSGRPRHQPTLKRAETYEAIFSEARVEFRRRDHDFDTHTEIVVSPEDDIELRRLRITNRSRMRRAIEVTSYAEVVLAPPAADALHPAFSNLFVQTEIVRDRQAILCTRRPRSVDERPPWMFHLMAVHGAERRRDFLRNRPRALHRPRTNRRRPPGTERFRGAVGQRGLGAGSDRRDPAANYARSRANGDDRHGLRHRRNPRRVPGPGRKIPGPASRRPCLRPGVDAQLGDAAADQCHGVRCATLRPPRELRHLREFLAARRHRRARAQPPGTIRPLGLCHFRRPAHRAAADRATRRTSIWCANSCRPTRTGA